DSAAYIADTWAWNGTAWALRATAGPTARNYAAAAYHAGREVTILFGGQDSSRNYSDTWEWNGPVWTLRSNAGPSARFFDGNPMAFDAARGVTVVFGGTGVGGNGGVGYTLTDTCEWNGTVWTRVALTGPSARTAPLMYDSVRRVTVLFGGW